MKKLAFLIIGLIITIQTTAQSDEPCETCLPEGIAFSAQSQIDNFPILNPNCTEILGDVEISGSDITNLNGLSVLTSVGGSLYIRHNNTLTSLTGLDNVISIGSLSITNNNALNSLTGLDNVTTIGGDLIIGYYSNGNPVLTSLTGLDNVTFIGNSLYIQDNPALTSLTGLVNVNSIGGDLGISGNDALTSLTGLNNVNSVGGDLWIIGNTALTSLAGLDNVSSVGGDLSIKYSDALTSLTGLNNIDAGTIIDLSITDNSNLATCEVRSICEYLTAPNGTVGIDDNAIGCNSPEEVQDSCEANAVDIDEQYIKDNLIFYPNPARQELRMSAGGFTIEEATIYTLTGQKTLKIRPKGETINISNLQPGMYIVEVTVEGGKVRQKLLVQR